MSTLTLQHDARVLHEKLPPLQTGDRLTAAEFHRRYEAMPDVKKAELIEGTVYMPSPVSAEFHGVQDSRLNAWAGYYSAFTKGVDSLSNTTVLLDGDNEPQPDLLLRIRPDCGGQSRVTRNFVAGAPELVGEVAATSASSDLHQKLGAYRRNGVREYIVWRTFDGALDWFVLEDAGYKRLAANADGVHESRVFPGLWLDSSAMLRGDLATVLAVLQRGIATVAHQDFVRALEKERAQRGSASP